MELTIMVSTMPASATKKDSSTDGHAMPMAVRILPRFLSSQRYVLCNIISHSPLYHSRISSALPR